MPATRSSPADALADRKDVSGTLGGRGQRGRENLNEAPLIQTQIERFRKKYTLSYHKVHDSQYNDKLLNIVPSLLHNQLNVVVLNFVDMLSHARTENKMIRELAQSEAAYRSLTRSWFQHSGTLELSSVSPEKGIK